MTLSYRAPEAILTQPIRIQLAGAGGTGSQFADALGSLEVTLRQLRHPGFKVQLLDHDHVSRANVGRQRFCPSDILLKKATILTHRINLFYGVNWTPAAERLEVRNVHCDLLITCTDSARFRAQVGRHFQGKQCDTLWLDFGNGASSGQAVLGHLGVPRFLPHDRSTVARLPNVYDLFPELDSLTANDRDQPSCSVQEAVAKQEWPINRLVATTGATILWNLLRKGAITQHGCLVDTAALSVRPLMVDPAAWAMFGYQQAA